MRTIRIIFPLFFCCFVLFSCSTDDQNQIKSRGTLIEYIKTGHLSKEQVIKNISEYDASDIAHNNISYYRLEYSTIYLDQPINSRGLLIIPEGISFPELIVYMHGTHPPLNFSVANKQSPSIYDGSGNDWTNLSFLEVRNIALALASSGYAVFMPDYIGYGITSDKEHPYIYYPELFESNIDGILAALDCMEELGYGENRNIFLAGWSQGAGASLSAHKYIEERYNDQLTVLASSSLAGPYNFVAFLTDVLQRKDYECEIMHMVCWAAYTLNKFSELKRPTDQIFTYPVYDQVSAIRPPSKVPAKVFNSYLVSNILNCNDLEFWKIVEGNSFYKGWRPIGKVFLHHGDADNTVPYYNSIHAYDGLTAMGGDVVLHTYKDGEHRSELGNYVRNTIEDFKQIK